MKGKFTALKHFPPLPIGIPSIKGEYSRDGGGGGVTLDGMAPGPWSGLYRQVRNI